MNQALYDQAIKDLAHQAHGSGRLAAPNRRARLDNPLCGDRIDIELRLTDSGIVAELAHQTKGCLLCRAAASILGLRAPGHSIAEIDTNLAALMAMLASDGIVPPSWRELDLFRPVCAHGSRHGCVLLPFRAFQVALQAV